MTAETLIAILSASGLILVTFANIFYNRHYRAAKEAQITALKQLIAPEVFEYFEKSRKILGEIIQSLKDDIASKEKEIAHLRTKSQVDHSKIQALTALRSQSEELARQVENIDRRLYHGQAQIQASVSVRKSTTP